eukprot:14186892-Alexandrium_andersonii.AAC.1
MRRRTAMISREELCPEISWKPLGLRNCGRARVRHPLAGAGSTTTRATRIAPMSADTSQKTAFWMDDAMFAVTPPLEAV